MKRPSLTYSGTSRFFYSSMMMASYDVKLCVLRYRHAVNKIHVVHIRACTRIFPAVRKHVPNRLFHYHRYFVERDLLLKIQYHLITIEREMFFHSNKKWSIVILVDDFGSGSLCRKYKKTYYDYVFSLAFVSNGRK